LGRRESCWRFAARQRCRPACRSGPATSHYLVQGNGTEAYCYLPKCRMGVFQLDKRHHYFGTRFLRSILTPTLVASVLMSPEQQLSTTVFSFWWMDVANEMCWLLAFLIAREDEVVDFLCQPSTELAWLMPHTQSVVCTALSHRLDQVARAARTATATSSDMALRALRMTVPCLRSIGNIATACQG